MHKIRRGVAAGTSGCDQTFDAERTVVAWFPISLKAPQISDDTERLAPALHRDASVQELMRSNKLICQKAAMQQQLGFE